MQEFNRESEMDEFFRRKLENASFTPPEAVWDKIDSKLPPAMPFYHRYKYVIAAGMFSLAFLISLQIHRHLIQPSSQLMEQASEDMKLFKSTDGVINGIKPFLSSDKRLEEYEANLANQSTNIDIIPQKVMDTWAKQRTPEEDVALYASLNNRYKEMSIVHGQVHDPGPPTGKIATGISFVDVVLASDEGWAQKDKKGRKNKKQVPEVPAEPLYEDDEIMDIHPLNVQEKKKAEALNANVYPEIKDVVFLESFPMDSILKFDDDEVSDISFNEDKSEHDKDRFFTRKGFYIGAYGGVNNNWLTKATKRSYNYNNNMDYMLQWGSIYGISTGLDFTSRWGIVVEMAYSSAEGQKFEETKEGVSTIKEIRLDYMKLPVLFKYRTSLLSPQSHKPIYFNILGGFHLSTIRTKNTYINNQLAFFDQKYNVHQWGLQGGVDVDFYLSKHLFITTGFRSGFGANLLSFPRPYGKDHNNPVSFQNGIYAKIQFRTPMRKKNRL